MSPPHGARRGAVVPSLLFAAALGSCDPDPAPQPRTDEAQPRALSLARDTFTSWHALGRLAAEPGTLKEARCPDEVIREANRGAPGRLLTVEYDYLSYFVAPYVDPYRGERGRWSPLTTAALRKLDPHAQTGTAEELTDLAFSMKALGADLPYWGVLRWLRRQAPRREGEQFHPGVLEGWLVVVDPVARQRLCQARLSVRSSAEVAGLAGRDVDDALWRDFIRQARRGIDEALRRISRELASVP